VNNIWDRYDKDDNDHLDKKESKKFIMDVLRESGLFFNSLSPEGDTRMVREVFHEIDSDNDHRISRAEMKRSIAKIIGLV
jgi:Ca2+-binding EF-hand superfamily protein